MEKRVSIEVASSLEQREDYELERILTVAFDFLANKHCLAEEYGMVGMYDEVTNTVLIATKGGVQVAPCIFRLNETWKPSTVLEEEDE